MTFMDPTGVCFHDGKKFGRDYGARASDATFTVSKNYNMDGFGAGQLIATLNVIVNDGKRQPPMSMGSLFSVRSIMDMVGSSSFPSHLRAASHETQPFDYGSDCHEIAYECSTYDKFLAGECGSCGTQNQSCYLINTMGNIQMKIDNSKIDYKPGTTMFITTGKRKFCIYHYQVVAQLREPSISVTRSIRLGHLKFEPSAGVVVNPIHRVSDNEYTQLLRLEDRISSFKDSIKLGKQSDDILSSLISIRINYMSHLSPQKRDKYSSKYCPDKIGNQLIKC